MVSEYHSAQAHLYHEILVIPGWMQVQDYQQGYPKHRVSPALGEVEQSVHLTGLALSVQRTPLSAGISLLWCDVFDGLPSSFIGGL